MRSCWLLVLRVVAVGYRVPVSMGFSGCWRWLWGWEGLFSLGASFRNRVSPSFPLVIQRSRRRVPGSAASARRGGEVTPPRAPPPGGGCRYSQPESLGEGEEEEVAVSAICRREVECEGAGGQGRRAWPAPPTLPRASAAARELRMFSLGERKWPEPSRLLVNPRVGKRPANSWPLRLPGKALPLPAG